MRIILSREKRFIKSYILFLLVYTLVYFFLFYSEWYLLGNNQYPLLFGDLHYNVNSAELYKSIGRNVQILGESEWTHIYGISVLYFLNLLLINPNNYLFFGYLLTFLLINVFALISSAYYKTVKGFIFPILLFTSPPVWLLIERGNFDGVVFLILILSSVLIYKNKDFIGIVFISFSVLFKFFTLPVFIYPFFHKKNIKVAMIYLIVFILTLILIIPDILTVTSLINSIANERFGIAYSSSFGLPVIGRQIYETFSINFEDLGISYNLLGLSFFMSSIITIIFLEKITKIRVYLDYKIVKKSFWHVIFIFFGLTTITNYLIGTRFDYSLIFTITATLALVTLLNKNQAYAKIIKIVAIIVFWSSNPPKFGESISLARMDIVGDTAIILLMSFIFIFLFKFFYNANMKFFNKLHLPRRLSN